MKRSHPQTQAGGAATALTRAAAKDGDRPEDLFSDDDSDEYESDSEELVEDSGDESDADGGRLWMPGTELAPDHVLEPDMTAYEMLHNVTAKWPCLTFDVLWDTLGEGRRTYPATAHFVAGTQADQPNHNEIQVLKCANLTRTPQEDEDDDDESDTEEDPELTCRAIPVTAGVNRIRASPSRDLPHHVCAMLEDGRAVVYDIESEIGMSGLSNAKPAHVLKHAAEGYAVDWATHIVTGDTAGQIRLTRMSESQFVSSPEYLGHTSSVEDLQWSPSEKTVFSSCSADGTIRIWDTRSRKRAPAITFTASTTDVNVMSWNTNVSYLLASGDDGGTFGVWDLRSMKSVASFDWHKQPITSIGWHPHDESVLAVSSPSQTTVWDLSVEPDPEEEPTDVEIPPQLMFCHLGQQDVKEIRWHPQIPGTLITTAASGFNIFKSAHQS